MKHGVFGSNLSRSRDEKKRLIRGLSRDLFLRGSVVTTRAKAKAIQPMVEKLITTAKEETQFSYRKMHAILGDASVVAQIISDAKTQFAGRTSGYTRIVRLDLHRSDAADMVQMSFVDPKVVAEVVKTVANDEKKPQSKQKSSGTRSTPKKVKEVTKK